MFRVRQPLLALAGSAGAALCLGRRLILFDSEAASSPRAALVTSAAVPRARGVVAAGGQHDFGGTLTASDPGATVDTRTAPYHHWEMQVV